MNVTNEQYKWVITLTVGYVMNVLIPSPTEMAVMGIVMIV